MDKIFVSYLTCASVFPWASRHPSCARQLSHFLTFLLLLLPQCLLYPQEELGQGVKGKLGSRRTGAQKGNLVLFSGLLTVRSPTSLQLNAGLHTKHSTAWMLSHPGHCSFLKYILSPLFLSTFPLGRFPSLSLSLGTNLPRLSGPSYFNDCLAWTSLAYTLLHEGSWDISLPMSIQDPQA